MNAYQYALTYPGWISYAACFLSALLILQGWKLFFVWGRWIVLFVRLALLKFDTWNLILITIFSFSFYLGRFQVADLLQWAKQSVYFGQFGNVGDEHQALIFEQELEKRNPDRSVTDVVKRVSSETAGILGCPRLWLYQCALTECALKPFTVRQDRIAGSWSQLTSAGLTGIKISGRQAVMQDVFTACENRDIETVMSLSKVYLVDRWIIQGRPILSRPVDAYLLLFAPGYVGKSLETVLYSGYSNPNYYKNAGLDAWILNKDGRILRQTSQIDGKITVGELGLIQEYKKNELLKQYLK